MKSLNLSKLFITLCIFTGSIISFNSAYATVPSDISKHWAKADITSAVKEQWALVQNGKFNPDKSATREEVAWMLIGACKTVQADGFDINKRADLKKFKDKPSTWAEGRIAIAVGNELIKGYPDGKLKPQSPITRAELSVLLSRKVKDEPPAGFSPFWDYIPEWALDGIKRVYAKGIIKGYPNGSFKANNGVTKAEALVMIKRWKQLQPPIPKPPCEEFKKIMSTVKNTGLSSDNKTLFYYGEEGKKSKLDEGKFRLWKTEDADFVVILNELKEETLQNLEKTLTVIIPSGAEKAVKEVPALPEFGEKEMEFDGIKATIRNYSSYIVIELTKN